MSRCRLILTSSVALFAASSCRTGARTNVDPNNPISVNVALFQVSDADITKYGLTVQMALCSDATGTKVNDTTYKFMIASIPKDTTCQIHLTGTKGTSAGVQFYTGNDGLYYKDDQVVIKQDATGALAGEAYLQAMFTPIVNQPGSKTWQITAPVNSKTVALTDACTCNLDCAPGLTNHNALMTKGATPNDGVCTFVNAVAASTTSVQCNKITVQCGESFFAAVYNPPGNADATANRSTAFPTAELQPGVPTKDGDVTIDVQIKNKPSGT